MENLNSKELKEYINESNVNMNLMPGFIDDLEGIINNEPSKNKYEIVKFHKMNMFPYFLIGKVVSKFDFDGVNKYLNGVGILVGPDVVLTVAHNLCHLTTLANGTKKITTTKKVCFFAAANGDFNLFEPVKSVKVHIPSSYINSLKSDNKDEQLYNDWGMVFLNTTIGDQIVKILDVEKTNNIKTVGGLYQFFVNNQNLDLMKLSKQTKTEKISIVGYTEYKDNYRNNTAYKFLSNFSKNSVPEVKTNCEKNMNSAMSIYANNLNIGNQGKLISELVNDKELLTISNEKKININININTSNADNGGESSSRQFNYLSQIPRRNYNMEGNNNNDLVDYIILGNEEYNKEVNLDDVDKLVMSESKGSLIGLNLDEEESSNNMTPTPDSIDKSTQNYDNLLKAIKYQISTYKGQSGSPIFLRIKRLTDKSNKSKMKPSYFYHFIGLHSRRGPLAGDLMFYESEKMNSLTENLMTGDQRNILKTNTHTHHNYLNFFYGDKDKDEQNMNGININNEIIKQNGICEYNIALSIIGDTIKEIKEIMSIEKTEESKLTTDIVDNGNYTRSEMYLDYLENTESENSFTLKSEFVLTKIFLNGNLQLSGLFKKNVTLSTIFSFGSKIFNVPKEYILLKDLNNNEFSHIYNYNFDHNKKYCDIMEDIETTTIMSFELMLNIKKFGEFLSNNILQKFLENYDLEESQLKNNLDKKYMKPLFHSIFAEINSFDSTQPIYGKLFKKIRKTILNKIGLNENKN